MSNEANKEPEALRLADALGALYSGTEARKAEAELRRQHTLIAELVNALGRLHASHKDYTNAHQRNWANGYPDLQWSLNIEEQAAEILANVKEQQS